MKNFLFFLLIISGGIKASAADVSIRDAKVVAMNWLNGYSISYLTDGDIDTVYVQTAKTETLYYIVTFKPSGWVFVSASDKVEPVLGYSESTKFEMDQLPIQVNEWMSVISAEIDSISGTDYHPSAKIEKRWVDYKSRVLNEQKLKTVSIASVGPLLSSTWAQGKYYNELAPVDASSSAGNGHAWIGCVATAMVQVMRYWEYPSSGIGSHSYTHYSYGLQSADFGASTYNWLSMPYDVTENNTEVQKINYHTAVSVDMDFDPVGSGAFLEDACNAFPDYFKYNTTLFHAYQRQWDSETDWKDMLKMELDRGRPIIYAGYSVTGNTGHAFVCDGYTDDYFHFNWGWGGVSNGNFLLSALEPGYSNYSYDQSALMGVQPIENISIEIPYVESFEDSGATDFSLSGWSAFSSKDNHNGTVSICLGDTSFSSYSKNCASLSFVVPSNGVLSFWVKRNMTEESTYNLQKAVLMSQWGSTELMSFFDGQFSDDGWVHYYEDISAYAGQEVRLLFVQQNFDLVRSEWMYIDDVEITGVYENFAPSIPIVPFPANEAVEADLQPTMGWVCTDSNGDDLTYKIYFGTSVDPPLVGSVFDDEYTPDLLSVNTSYYWKVIADDGSLQTESSLWSFTTTGLPPDMSICGLSQISDTSVVVCGSIEKENGSVIGTRGVCWSENVHPRINDNHVMNEDGENDYSCFVTGLKPYTTYYVRSYANSDEGVGYSEEESFLTLSGLPSVGFVEVGSISRTAATIEGEMTEVNDTAIVRRGVVWSSDADFNTENITIVAEEGYWLTSERFEINIVDIPELHALYFKVFVENGIGISYSEVQQLVTKNSSPVLDLDSDNSSGQEGAGFIGVAMEQKHGGAVVDSDVDIVDGDYDIIQNITLILSSQLFDDDEYLQLVGEWPSVIVEGNQSDTLVLTDNGVLNNEEWEDILRSVEYWNDNDAPDSSIIRQVDIVLFDGVDSSNVAIALMRVQPINDPPVCDVLPSFSESFSFGETVTVIHGEWQDALDECDAEFTYSYAWQIKIDDDIQTLENQTEDHLLLSNELCGALFKAIETVNDNNCGGDDSVTAVAESGWYEVQKISQTLQFDVIPKQYFSYLPIVLQGEASSGLPLTYKMSVSSLVDISNDTLWMKGIGSTLISCSQEGNKCYYSAQAKYNRQLTIYKGEQTIDCDVADSVNFDQGWMILNASSSSGLPLTTELSDSLLVDVRGDSIFFKGLGSVELTFSQQGDDLIAAADTVRINLTIVKGEQTIVSDIDTLLYYGAGTVELYATATSGLDLFVESSDTAVLKITNDSFDVVGVGDCVLTLMQEGNEYYNSALAHNIKIHVEKGIQQLSLIMDDELHYGSGLYPFLGISSSGLDVNITSSDTTLLQIVGEDSLCVAGVGQVFLSVKQAGNERWNELDTLVVLNLLKGVQKIGVADTLYKRYGDADFLIDAEVNSGMDLKMTIANEMVVVDNDGLLHLVGVGESKIEWTQIGDDLWNSVSENSSLIVNKGLQSIVFDSINPAQFGDDKVLLSAFSNSGLPLLFESSDTSVAVVIDRDLFVVNAGTSVISVSQFGDNLWESALAVSMNFQVEKAEQTIEHSISETLTTGDTIRWKSFIASSDLSVDEIIPSDSNLVDMLDHVIVIKDRGSLTLSVGQSGNRNYLPVMSDFDFDLAFPVGISEFMNVEFSVFPNPSQGVVHLMVEGQVEYPLSLTVLNVLGQVQLSREIPKSFNVIDMGELKGGVYFVVIRSETEYKIKKLTINRP